MNENILLGFRNVMRNKRRTIITFLLVAVSAFLISVFRFMAYGSHEDMIKHVTEMNSGYLQIAANGWSEDNSIERALDITPEIYQKLYKYEEITEISPRIFGGALLSFKDSSKFITVLAADPQKEKNITVMHEKIIAGRHIHSGQPEAILGYKLAKNNGITVGSEIHLIGSQFDGSIGAIKVKVVGIFKAIDSILDNTRIIIPLEPGQELYALDDPETGVARYTSLALGLKDHRIAGRLDKKLKKDFPLPPLEEGIDRSESDNYKPVALNFEELNPAIVQIVIIDQVSGELMFVFLILIMSFGILNNVQMSIQERIRELGIMLAIGTKPSSIQKVIFMEVFFVFVPALIVGFGAGTWLSWNIQQSPIPFSVLMGDPSMDALYEDLGFKPMMYALVDLGEMLIAPLSLLVPSLIFIYIATRRVFRLKPAAIITTL